MTAFSDQERARIATAAAELDTMQDQAQMDYLQRVGNKKMSELIAREIVASDRPTEAETAAEVDEPAEWPTDPDHPLNDPATVELLSSDQVRELLQQWWSSTEYRNQVDAAQSWRDQPGIG